MSLCVVVSGDPASGFQIIGLFKHAHHAAEWADEWLPDLDWWVLPVVSITEVENEHRGTSEATDGGAD